MQNYFAWACAALVLECFAFGQRPQGGTGQLTETTARAELTNLLGAKIKAEWQAIKNKDQKAYGDLLTDDYVAVEADGGGERYKWKALSELQQSLVTDYTLSFLKVTALCSDAAFVRYEVFVRFPPKLTVPFEKILVGEVWVKRRACGKPCTTRKPESNSQFAGRALLLRPPTGLVFQPVWRCWRTTCGEEKRAASLGTAHALRAPMAHWQSGGMEAMASSEPHACFFFAGVRPGLG